MLIFFFLFLGIFTVVMQSTFFPLLPDWLGRPDFIFILVVFAAYKFGWIHGLFYAFVLGWMTDVMSGIQLGIFPLQYILLFTFLKVITENSPLKESAYQVPLVGFSYFIIQMGFYFLYSIILPGTLPEWSWNRMVQETIIILLATIPSFIAFNYCYEFFSKRRVVHRVVRKRTGNEFR